MRHRLQCTILLSAFILSALALPQKPSNTSSTAIKSRTPTSVYSVQAATGTYNVEAIDRNKNMKQCMTKWPAAPIDDPNFGQAQCYGICVGDPFKQKDGKTHNNFCSVTGGQWQPISGTTMPQVSAKLSLNPCFLGAPPKPRMYSPQPGDPVMVIGGNCSCDSGFINELANDFVGALPAIANIGCELIMNSVGLVAEIGAAAIPGVGEAIDGGMIAGIEAAKLAKYSYGASQEAVDSFSNWMNPCGPSQLPGSVQDVFDTLSAVAPNRLPKGWTPPKGVPKEGGKPGDEGDPKKSEPPNLTSKPVKTMPAATSKPAVSTLSEASTRPAVTTKPSITTKASPTKPFLTTRSSKDHSRGTTPKTTKFPTTTFSKSRKPKHSSSSGTGTRTGTALAYGVQTGTGAIHYYWPNPTVPS